MSGGIWKIWKVTKTRNLKRWRYLKGWIGGEEGGQPGIRRTSKEATYNQLIPGQDIILSYEVELPEKKKISLKLFSSAPKYWGHVTTNKMIVLTRQDRLITKTVKPITSFRMFLQEGKIGPIMWYLAYYMLLVIVVVWCSAYMIILVWCSVYNMMPSIWLSALMFGKWSS